jgi:hypothetical protein
MSLDNIAFYFGIKKKRNKLRSRKKINIKMTVTVPATVDGERC